MGEQALLLWGTINIPHFIDEGMEAREKQWAAKGQPALCPKSMCLELSQHTLNYRSLEVKKHSRIDTGEQWQVVQHPSGWEALSAWGETATLCVCVFVCVFPCARGIPLYQSGNWGREKLAHISAHSSDLTNPMANLASDTDTHYSSMRGKTLVH